MTLCAITPGIAIVVERCPDPTLLTLLGRVLELEFEDEEPANACDGSVDVEEGNSRT